MKNICACILDTREGRLKTFYRLFCKTLMMLGWANTTPREPCQCFCTFPLSALSWWLPFEGWLTALCEGCPADPSGSHSVKNGLLTATTFLSLNIQMTIRYKWSASIVHTGEEAWDSYWYTLILQPEMGFWQLLKSTFKLFNEITFYLIFSEHYISIFMYWFRFPENAHNLGKKKSTASSSVRCIVQDEAFWFKLGNLSSLKNRHRSPVQYSLTRPWWWPPG